MPSATDEANGADDADGADDASGADDVASRTCSRCGATAGCAPGGLPEGWSSAFERGGVVYHCLSCLRANIRAIEGKLSEEWWE